MNIKEYMKHHIVIMDGAMGTYFDSLNTGSEAVAEDCNLLAPEKIKSIHLEYLHSGANLIRTNTFALNREFALSKGYESEETQTAFLKDCVHAACMIAKEAVRDSASSAWIAADIGPISEHFFQHFDRNEKKRISVFD